MRRGRARAVVGTPEPPVGQMTGTAAMLAEQAPSSFAPPPSVL